MFSATVLENKNGSWSTTITCLRRFDFLMSLISTLSIRIWPELGSIIRLIILTKVDLPLPVLPIIAIVSPALIFKLILFRTGIEASENLKLTSLNSILPVMFTSLTPSFSYSSFKSRISKILFPAISERFISPN